MKTRIISYLLLCIIFMTFMYCGSEPNSNEENVPFPAFVSSTQIPCNSSEDLTYNTYIDEDIDSFSYEYLNDTLKLDFNFTSTCGSVFKDSTSASKTTIHIFIEDTSQYHEYCLCSYESLFWFYVEDMRSINLILDLKTFSNNQFVTCLDTVLTLYH